MPSPYRTTSETVIHCSPMGADNLRRQMDAAAPPLPEWLLARIGTGALPADCRLIREPVNIVVGEKLTVAEGRRWGVLRLMSPATAPWRAEWAIMPTGSAMGLLKALEREFGILPPPRATEQTDLSHLVRDDRDVTEQDNATAPRG